MRRFVLAAIALFLLGSCGSGISPSELRSAEAMASGKLSDGASRLAPEHWMKGTEALERSRVHAKKGREVEARLAAVEALIHFKTAVAEACGKTALERTRQAEKDVKRYEGDREKFETLRRDAELRYLKIMSYHMEQKDDAFVRRSTFENEREKYNALTGEEKKQWDEARRPFLEKSIGGARGLVEAAKLLMESKGSAELDEAENSVESAAKALDGSWDAARPLVDEALMKAERLLMHARILAEPEPLENPAASETLLGMMEENLKDEHVVVSAAYKGILVSVGEAWDGKKKGLAARAVRVVDEIADFLGERDRPVVIAEAYMFVDDGDRAEESSRAMAGKAVEMLREKLPSAGLAAVGWGNSPVHDPGPCLSDPCAGGRLDLVIVKY